MSKSYPYKDPEYKKKWYLKNKENITHQNRLLTYGISKEAFECMFMAQKSRCKICGSQEHKGKNWNLDHDKKTGLIRGILCMPCNFGLGYFQDNTEFLKSAIVYLKENTPWRA